MKTPWIQAASAALLLLAGNAGTVAAEEELGGRPFSPPGAVVEMPPDWQGKAVDRPAGVDVALTLDQQLYPALLPLIQAYAHEHGLKVAVQDGTCGVSAGALAAKNADVTGWCCPPGAFDRMPGVRYHTVGIAAIALIVNPVNPIKDLSLAEARALFGGTAERWSELPVSGVSAASGSEVRAVVRLHCKPRPGHWRLLLDNADKFSPNADEVPSIRDMIAEVARLPTAIGYETLWHVADNVSVGAVKVVRLGGIDPRDGASLARGRYPLYRVFNITTWEGRSANGSAQLLVDWLLAHAADIAPSYGIVPAAELRRDGWSFVGDEVVGEPER